MQQLLFQQTYSLFLGWLIIAQKQYQSMDQCCEDISRWEPLQFTNVKKGSSDL